MPGVRREDTIELLIEGDLGGGLTVTALAGTIVAMIIPIVITTIASGVSTQARNPRKSVPWRIGRSMT